jgi:two-component system, NarL family, nitrate/nitrite sensor histidine kinase NarX
VSSTASLSTKLIRIGAGLLVVALASIGLTLWVTWQLEGGAAAVNEAGRLRMQTWRLNSAVQAELPPSEVASLVGRFDEQPDPVARRRPGSAAVCALGCRRAPRICPGRGLWLARREAWQQERDVDGPHSVESAATFVEAIDDLVNAIERQLASLTAVLNLFQFLMMALAIGGAVVMLYTGYRYVINPLGNLRQGLRQLESGDFSTRVQVHSNDEFGQVAAGFNRMAATLQSLYGGWRPRCWPRPSASRRSARGWRRCTR